MGNFFKDSGRILKGFAMYSGRIVKGFLKVLIEFWKESSWLLMGMAGCIVALCMVALVQGCMGARVLGA